MRDYFNELRHHLVEVRHFNEMTGDLIEMMRDFSVETPDFSRQLGDFSVEVLPSSRLAPGLLR